MLTPTETAVLWGLHHPYWLIAIALILLMFLQLSLSLAGQLLRRSLKWLGQSPLFLGRWLLTKTPLIEESKDQQLINILAKLELLQQEQEALMAELQSKLRSRSLHQDE